MEYRELGRTGYRVSTMSFGAWAIGGTWGEVDDSESLAALHTALDHGVNFFDTADVYGDGRSEQLLARLRRERSEPFYIATKAGRRLPAQTVEGYNAANLTNFVERSLRNLEVEALDLLQLHCPPTPVYDQDVAFDVLDSLVAAGKIRHYGVSVETVAEALRAIEHPNVQSVQIIFNLFRFKPSDTFFAAAEQRKVGILARVPLASGLLSGKFRADSHFAADDHRAFNRNGESFDRGETFSGVNYATGLRAVDELRALVPANASLAQFALRWITMFSQVTCAIPGAKRPDQVAENVAAGDLPPLDEATMQAVANIYDNHIRPLVHDLW